MTYTRQELTRAMEELQKQNTPPPAKAKPVTKKKNKKK
jgi:hypothetical protein